MPMADANIDILTIDVKVETKDAKKDIKDLESTLEKVGSKTTGRKGAENPFDAMGKSAEETSKKVEDIGEKLDGLTTALGRVETAFNNADKAKTNFTGGKSQKKETEDEIALEYKRLKAIEKRQKMEAYVDKKTNPESTEGIYDQLKAEEKYQKMLDYIASKRSPKAVDPVAEEYKALKEAEKRQKMLDYIASQKGESPAGGDAATSMLDSIVSKAEAAKGKIQELYTAMKPLAKLALFPITKPFQLATRAATAFGRSIGKLLPALKRVAVYRAIRFALRAITDGFRQGTQNAYQWSKALGGTFAASMDRLSTASLYLKNSLGALATPIINAVAPAIDWLIDKFVALLNVINQVIALLTGAKTWTKAIKYPKEYAAAADQAAGGAGKLAKAMTTILAIDELNPLNADNGGGGGGGGAAGSALDYSEMFKEVETTSNALDKLFEPVTAAWQNKGQEVLDSLSNALSGVKQLAESVASSFFEVWENGTGQETIEHILGIFTGINNTIGNIARQLAIGWNTDNLGTQIIQNFWNILNNILGLWDRIANATAEWAKDLDFTPILTAFGNLSGALERLSKVVTDSLGDAWEKVILPFGKWLIESGLPAAIEAIAKAINFVAMALETLVSILKEMKKFIDGLMNMSLPDFLKGFFGGDLAVGGSPSELASGAAAATFGVKFKVTDIIDKIPGAKKIIEGLTGWLQKRKLGEKVTLPISGLTAGMTKRTLGEKTKAPISLAANMVRRTLGNKVVLPIPNLTGNITKRTVGGKILDPVTGMTASFNKSQNAMSEEQRRFYATARFNQSQNALGTPSINARANFTDYTSEFSKVKMPIQITAAYRPDGVRIDLWKAEGGAYYGGKWHDISQFATGGVPDHGSLYIAGEAGSELVGHIGGRTEVLNQSQIASTIASATAMSNASQNSILSQLLSVAQQIYEGQGDVRAYIPAGEVVQGLQRSNRRDGRAVVPMGV